MSTLRQSVSLIIQSSSWTELTIEQIHEHAATYAVDIDYPVESAVLHYDGPISLEWLVITDKVVMEICRPKNVFPSTVYVAVPRVVTKETLLQFKDQIKDFPEDLPDNLELTLIHVDGGQLEWEDLQEGYQATLWINRNFGRPLDDHLTGGFRFNVFDEDEEEDDEAQEQRTEPGGVDPEHHVED